MKFMSFSSGIRITPDNITQIFIQTREMLIDEIIRLNAAEMLDIKIEDKQIDEAIKEIAGKNKLSKAKFESQISQIIELDIFREQIASQILWQQYLYMTIFSQINISEYEISDYIQTTNSEKTFYKFEIVKFLIDESEEKTIEFAEGNYQKLLSNEIDFQDLKARYSSTGNDKLKIYEEYEDDIIDEILFNLKLIKNNEYTKPFRVDDNILLIKLLDKSQKSQIKTRKEIKQLLTQKKYQRKIEVFFDDLKSQAFIERYN